MKTVSVCILFIALLLASFSQWLMIAAFNINQNYIANELCINRNNQAMHCNGHCYLGKQMSKEEKPDASSNGSKEKFEVQFFCLHEVNHTDNFLFFTMNRYASVNQFSPQEFIYCCFHPPCFA